MIPPAFEYLRPNTLQEAIALLCAHGEEARVLAGGHSLIPLMKLRLASPRYLIDIGRLRDLAYIRTGTAVHIGALTTHAAIASSALLKARLPLLPETAARIGDAQVRNRGTIGGSLVHAHPAADLAAALLALEAEILVEGPKGQRCLAASDFFVGMFTTALRADEVLIEVRLPPTPLDTRTRYLRAEDKASHFALVGVATIIGMFPDGSCHTARVSVTGLGPTPFRARAVERMLLDRHLDAHAIAAAALRVCDGVEPLGELFASAQYRAHLARIYTERALAHCAAGEHSAASDH